MGKISEWKFLIPNPMLSILQTFPGLPGPLKPMICTREFPEDVSLEVGPEPGDAESRGLVVILTDGPR